MALAHLPELLVDHAHCEKKAAAQALSLVQAYPQHERLVRRLTGLAIEELRHFRAVYTRLRKRGLELGRDPGDPYAQALRKSIRSGGPGRLADRLLVAGLIESRSHERLALLADVLRGDLGDFYRSLARAEVGHAVLFRDLAVTYEDEKSVRLRLGELAQREAEIVAELPIEPRIH